MHSAEALRTPVFVLDIAQLRRNLETARRIQEGAGAKILLATKAFAMPAIFPLMTEYLDGTTASGLYEARLGAEHFGKAVHVYSPAYLKDELEELEGVATDIYFNSAEQLSRFGTRVRNRGARIGLRINPGFSNATLGGELYNPCAPYSRFGETPDRLGEIDWSLIDTLHVHALCESMHDGSVGLIEHVASEFGEYVRQVDAVNFGGGHFINMPGYDVDALISALKAFRTQFDVDIILEPGSGLVVNTGELHANVLALHNNEKTIAILDASASTHMPDVLEVPYRPDVIGAGEPGHHLYTYILAGRTCMTGDIIGEYSFPDALKVGDRITFTDQMHYSFVKANTFNGNPLANLAIRHEDGRYESISDFDYGDFRQRLGR